jgi:2-oxo-3-hexenedioate decarboxylase/2-keto-4-pentenoate hydratase
VTDIERAASALLTARTEARPVTEALQGELLPGSVDEAYTVQDRIAELTGEPTAGWKVGAGGAPMQARLGLSEPFRGRYTRSFVLHGPATLPFARFSSAPGVECEVAVRLGRALGRCDEAEAEAAVDALLPMIEVVGSRLGPGLPSGAAKLIADNGLSAYLVHGDPVAVADAPPLDRLSARLEVDGEEKAQGTLESGGVEPFVVLAWLANHLAGRGQQLDAGTIVTTGSLTGVRWAKPGERVVCDLGALGSVAVDFPG